MHLCCNFGYNCSVTIANCTSKRSTYSYWYQYSVPGSENKVFLVLVVGIWQEHTTTRYNVPVCIRVCIPVFPHGFDDAFAILSVPSACLHFFCFCFVCIASDSCFAFTVKKPSTTRLAHCFCHTADNAFAILPT